MIIIAIVLNRLEWDVVTTKTCSSLTASLDVIVVILVDVHVLVHAGWSSSEWLVGNPKKKFSHQVFEPVLS